MIIYLTSSVDVIFNLITPTSRVSVRSVVLAEAKHPVLLLFFPAEFEYLGSDHDPRSHTITVNMEPPRRRLKNLSEMS